MDKQYKIEGMHCRSCEVLLKESLEQLGVSVKRISHLKGNVQVEFDENIVKESAIQRAIRAEGYVVVN